MNCDLIKLTTFISAFGPTKPNFTFGQQKRLRPPVNSLLTGKWAIDPLRSSESVYQMGHGKLNIYDQDGINLELVDSVELQTKSPDSMVVWGGEVYYVADTRLIKYSVDHDKEVKFLSCNVSSSRYFLPTQFSMYQRSQETYSKKLTTRDLEI